MATKPQRAADILAAIKNLNRADITPAELDRATAAFTRAYRPNDDPATLPPNDRAAILINAVRAFIKATIHSQELTAAQETARLTVTPPDLGDD